MPRLYLPPDQTHTSPGAMYFSLRYCGYKRRKRESERKEKCTIRSKQDEIFTPHFVTTSWVMITRMHKVYLLVIFKEKQSLKPFHAITKTHHIIFHYYAPTKIFKQCVPCRLSYSCVFEITRLRITKINFPFSHFNESLH